MIWYDMIWYDMIWYDMIWYDMIWYDMIWYDAFDTFFQGDSGGPLVHFGPHPMQIGILSFGDKFCHYNRTILDVYISVGFFRDWIDQILATPWLGDAYLHCDAKNG